jgi:hypothetical protein
MRKLGLLILGVVIALVLPVYAGSDDMPAPKRTSVARGDAPAPTLPSDVAYHKARAAMLLLMVVRDGRGKAPGGLLAQR